MTALDFPAAPTVGQVFDRWAWDGTKWVLSGLGGAGGIAAHVFGTAIDKALAVGEVVPGMTKEVSLKAGHTYRVTASWLASNNAGTADVLQTVGLRLDGVEVIAKTQTLHATGSWLFTPYLDYVFVQPADAKRTIDVYSQTVSYYVGSYNRRGLLVVEDITPGGGGGGVGGGAPVWTPYTPVVSGVGLNLGSTPQVAGEWTADGDLITWRAEVAAGGTGIAAGTGGYGITLPVPAKIGVPAFQIVGGGWLYGAGGFHQVTLDGAGPARVIGVDAATQGFNTGGHTLAVSGSYRAAAIP